MPRGVYSRKTETPAQKKHAKALAKDQLPELLKLTELELLKMEKLSAQIRAADSDIVIAHSQKMSYIAQIDPQGNLAKFDNKLKSLQQERADAELEYKGVSSGVEERLDINLKEFAYDDRTGVLNRVVEHTPAATPTPSARGKKDMK